jgi:hypothetical protein
MRQSVWDELTLGTRWEGDAAIFELYIAGANSPPEAARPLCCVVRLSWIRATAL